MATTSGTTNVSELGGMPQWRLKGIGLLRILFGIVWAVDAWFKWQPSFISGFSSYLSGAQDGQPLLLHLSGSKMTSRGDRHSAIVAE